jgi:hypothetical protein
MIDANISTPSADGLTADQQLSRRSTTVATLR